MKLVLISLAFLAAFVSAQLPDPRCPPDNPRPPVHLPHPYDCSLFFLCSFGIAHLMPPCPDGLLFDTPSSSCRPAADARCGEQPTLPPTIPPVTEPPATEPPVTEPPATEPPATEPPTTVLNFDEILVSFCCKI